jgi:hypothetical protein
MLKGWMRESCFEERCREVGGAGQRSGEQAMQLLMFRFVLIFLIVSLNLRMCGNISNYQHFLRHLKLLNGGS